MNQLSNNKKQPLTTYQEREVIMAHNQMLVQAFIKGGLSLSCPISIKPVWDGDYHLVQSLKDVEGI